MANIRTGKAAAIGLEQTPHFGFGKIIMWTLLFQLAWSWNTLKNIIQQGEMPGPDDFMRLNQVRSLLDGQSWYDSIAYRMLPPAGADIHWSRIIDGPIAALITLLSPLFGQQLAERITTILWPTILLVLTILVITKICDSLFTRYNRLLPVLFTVLCVSSLEQFVPGRIDHHNVQILIYVSLLWCLVNWQSPNANIFAGLLIPLSISIGLDVMLFIILFMAWFGIQWVLDIDKSGKSLRRFAGALFAFALLLYPLNIAPSQWLVAQCDANSPVYLLALLLISSAMLIMSTAGNKLNFASNNQTIGAKLALGGVLAAVCAAILLALYPQCAGGPYAAVSEELNTRWLSNVAEARNLFAILEDFPEYWIKTVAYCAFISAIAIWLFTRDLPNKFSLAIIFAAFAVSFAMSVFQYRTIRIGFFAAIPICVLATELIARKLVERYGKGSIFSVTGQVFSVVMLSTVTWALAGILIFGKPAASTPVSGDANTSSEKTATARTTCFHQDDYKLLSSLPKGHVMSGLTSAAAILIFTDKTTISGPYHRNARGILDVKDFFRSDMEKPRKIAARHKVDYVAFCRVPVPDQVEDDLKATLKYHLLTGNIPDWLEQLSSPQDKMLVFRVK